MSLYLELNEYGLFVENGSYITFTDSQFTGASLANILLDGAVNSSFVACLVPMVVSLKIQLSQVLLAHLLGLAMAFS